MSEENENVKAVIAAEVDPLIKEAFKRWWKENNYATEAEAIRAFVREKIGELTVGEI